MKALFIGSLSIAVFMVLSTCLPKTQSPNIVLINIDDLGWKDLGVMGSKFYDTPHLDALIQSGTLFTEGYAAAANCAPSRASLMTGKWPTRHGVYTVNSSARGASKDRRLIPIENTHYPAPKFRLIPEVLRENGYRTCHAGKWHLGKDPLADGFDVNIGGGQNGMPLSYYPPYKNVDIPEGKSEYLTDLIMEKAIEFVTAAEGPFFLHYAPYAVHVPIQGVDSLRSKYQDRPTDGRQSNIDYATMIENLDRNIGLLIETLRTTGKDDNLLFIITSDNGGLYGITEQRPLRAGKGAYYEGGIRVPVAFVWPGNIPAGERRVTPISNLDFFPTLLSIAGVEYAPEEYDGVSLWPFPTETTALNDRPLFWHFPVYLQAYNKADNENRDSLFRTRPGSVVRKGDWKLHYYFEDKGIELYHLAEDIGESNNLEQQEVKKREELLAELKEWWDRTAAPIPMMPNPEYLEVDER